MKQHNLRTYLSAVGFLLIATATVHAAKDNPTAREVLDRHVVAMGGEKAILAASGMHYTGTLKVQGLDGTFELHRGKHKALFSVEIAGLGQLRQGYDGTNGWAMGQTGPQLLEGSQLEQMQYQADPGGELRRKKNYRSIESVGLSEFDATKLQTVQLVTLGGEEITEYYDPETGLRHASVSVQETPVGKQEITMLYSEYRQFGDLELPTRIEQRGGGQDLVRIIDAVMFGAIDDAIFVVPDPIQELIEAAQ